MRPVLPCLGLVGLLLASPVAAAPRVVTDIPPVQSLVARVLGDGTLPPVLVPPGMSEHEYQFRLSDAALLSEAEIVVMIGPALTPWIADPVRTLAARAYVLALTEVPGIDAVIPLPAAEAAEAAQAGEHGHEEAGDDGQEHDHEGDPHLWLNPKVAAIWLPVIADALADRDPAMARRYRANAEAAAAELAALDEAIAVRMRKLEGRGFVVHHDAYWHFTGHYGLRAIDAIRKSHAEPPGAAHLAEIRSRIEAGAVACVFTEPEFAADLAERLTEGTPARVAALDPLGATLPPGPRLYPALIAGLADGIERCLAP
jgi:zinc transport system substrate-binding protein